jgi:hypothetical protein
MATSGPPTSDRGRWTSGAPSTNGTLDSAVRQTAMRLVVVAYISAIAIPPAGLILGIVVATRPLNKVSRHGKWIIALSIIAAAIWFLVFKTGSLTSDNSDMSGGY